MQSNFATTISFSSATTCLALTLLVAFLGRNAASRHFRFAAVSGLAACVYCLSDAVPAGDAADEVTVWSGRVSVLASSVHGAGWIAFLAAWGARQLSRFERGLIVASLLAGLVALVPGAVFEAEVIDRTVHWSPSIYRDPVFASLGSPVLALVLGEQMVAAVIAYRMRRENPTALFVSLALGFFCVVLVVDWLTSVHLIALPDLVGPALALVFLSIGAIVVADAAASAAKSVALVRASVALAERENLAAVGQLAAVVAHEVRNPVAIIFGALYWLMSRIALPRVGGILAARGARISGDLESAAQMQKQAAEASAAYDATLSQAKARAQSLAQETHDKLHAENEAKRHALEDELNRKLAAAEEQIAGTKNRAMANVESIARDAAGAIIEHLTGKAASPEAIDAAFAAPKPS